MATQGRVQIRRISVDEVRKRKKELVFVDARSATALTRNPRRVPGAIPVPMNMLEDSAKQLPRGRALVTYCT
jgi:rhodanese-related sulfurtransferase